MHAIGNLFPVVLRSEYASTIKVDLIEVSAAMAKEIDSMEKTAGLVMGLANVDGELCKIYYHPCDEYALLAEVAGGDWCK